MGHGGHSFAFGHLRAEKMDLGFSGAPRSDVVSSSSSSSAASSAGNNYIEHTVSKLDTLAGIAIKYGVEVSDIKRMNGLTTDLQMFAHKTLHIPLPGRHPPSAALSRNPRTSSGFPSVQPPGYGIHASYANVTSDSVNGAESKKSVKRPVSVAMNLLRGYYGLSQRQVQGNEGTEMAVYKADCEPSTAPQTHANYRSEDLNKMFKSYYNGDLLMKAEKDLMDEDSLKTNGSLNMGLVGDAGLIENEKTNEGSVRRRSKGEGIDYLLGATETVLKQDGSSTGRGGKGLSLRPKSGSKGSLSNDATGAFDHPFTISDPNMADALVVGVSALKGLGDSPGNGKTAQNFMSKVRRSSSTPSLQDSGKISPLKSVSRSAAKGESQGLLTSAVSRPLFDGIPRPLNGWRNKAALD